MTGVDTLAGGGAPGVTESPREGRPKRPPKHRRTPVRTTMTYLFVGLVAALVCLPLWTMLVAAVSPLQSLLGDHFPLWPRSFRWSNFSDAWNYAPFGTYYLNSVGTTAAIVAFQLVTSSLAAYALAFIRFRFAKVVFRLIVLAMFVPMQAIFVASYVLMSEYGWIDSYKVLVVPFVASAFGVFFLTQSFKSFPYEVIESGLVDGCGHVRALFTLVLPNMKPALATLAVLNAVFHFNYFFWPLVTTSSTNRRVMPVGLVSMLSESSTGQLTPWSLIMAACLFMIVPLVVAFALAQRVMVRGVARVGLR